MILTKKCISNLFPDFTKLNFCGLIVIINKFYDATATRIDWIQCHRDGVAAAAAAADDDGDIDGDIDDDDNDDDNSDDEAIFNRSVSVIS